MRGLPDPELGSPLTFVSVLGRMMEGTRSRGKRSGGVMEGARGGTTNGAKYGVRR